MMPTMPTRTWLSAALVLISITIFPFFLTEIPPVVDYPNHLARAYLLAFGKADPVLTTVFEPHWDIIPNLAGDLFLLPLLHIMPVYDAGKVLLALSLLLPVIGSWTYSFCLFRRLSLWSLGTVLVAFNFSFLLGLMNFQLGLGMAFLTAAAWIRWRESWPYAVFAVAAVGAVAVISSR
jgi:hypothetical protein